MGGGGGNYDISYGVSDILNDVRCVGALLVLIGHGFSFFQISIFKDDSYFPYIQSLAVLIFFILSGFLTDNTLSKEKEKYKYKRFIISRAKRIYEYYLGALLMVVIIDKMIIAINPSAYLHYGTLSFEILIKNIMMIPRMVSLNIFGIQSLNIPVVGRLITNDTLGSARPFWTLFIEWWLYVFYGYYKLVYKEKHQNTINLLDIFMVILFALMFVHLDFNCQCCILCFGGGVLVNRIYRVVKIEKGLLFAISFVMMLLFIVVSQSVRKAYCLEECLLLVILFLVILEWGEEYRKCSRSLVLKEVAGITYPLYLIHYSIMELIIYTSNKWSFRESFVTSLVVSIGCSLIFYYSVIFVKKILNRISIWKK